MRIDAMLALVDSLRALGIPQELLEPLEKWIHQAAASTGFIL